MNKTKKIILMVICNLVIFIFFVFIIDFCIYKTQKISEPDSPYNFKYLIKPVFTDYKYHFTGADNMYAGRKPDGLEYENKPPIILFGCSFAYGQYLNYNQTFSYKLAHSLKQPVYNRAIPGSSFQHMYYQTTQDYFYESVPKSDTVIYIMINDHFRRTLSYSFNVLDTYFVRHFSIKNGKLVEDNYDNKLANFFKSLYISKLIHHKYVREYINNKDNRDELTDTTLSYFIETRKNLEQAWGNNINFTVILYDNWGTKYKNVLKNKLIQNNFNVIDVKDLTNEDLNSEKYLIQENKHPKEAAWNLLTPKIIEKLELQQ